MVIDLAAQGLAGRGGIETVLEQLVPAWKRNGHTVRAVFAFSPGNGWNPGLHQMSSAYDTYREDARTDRVMDTYKRHVEEHGPPDVVLAAVTGGMAPCTRVVLEEVHGTGRPPVLSWEHGVASRPAEPRARQVAFLSADAHLAISSSVQNEIRSLVGPSALVMYVGNPVPPSDLRIPRPTDPLFVWVGRVENGQKRLDVALAALRSAGVGRLWVVGEGPDRAQFESLVAADPQFRRRVRFLGWRDDPWSAVTEATALVLSSDFETFGLVAAEALARGLAVITTDCGGVTDFVRAGVNGWVVPKGDAEAMATVMRHVASGGLALPDPEVCAQSVAMFQPQRVANAIIQGARIVRAQRGLPLVE